MDKPLGHPELGTQYNLFCQKYHIRFFYKNILELLSIVKRETHVQNALHTTICLSL